MDLRGDCTAGSSSTGAKSYDEWPLGETGTGLSATDMRDQQLNEGREYKVSPATLNIGAPRPYRALQCPVRHTATSAICDMGQVSGRIPHQSSDGFVKMDNDTTRRYEHVEGSLIAPLLSHCESAAASLISAGADVTVAESAPRLQRDQDTPYVTGAKNSTMNYAMGCLIATQQRSFTGLAKPLLRRPVAACPDCASL